MTELAYLFCSGAQKSLYRRTISFRIHSCSHPFPLFLLLYISTYAQRLHPPSHLYTTSQSNTAYSTIPTLSAHFLYPSLTFSHHYNIILLQQQTQQQQQRYILHTL